MKDPGVFDGLLGQLRAGDIIVVYIDTLERLFEMDAMSKTVLAQRRSFVGTEGEPEIPDVITSMGLLVHTDVVITLFFHWGSLIDKPSVLSVG